MIIAVSVKPIPPPWTTLFFHQWNPRTITVNFHKFGRKPLHFQSDLLTTSSIPIWPPDHHLLNLCTSGFQKDSQNISHSFLRQAVRFGLPVVDYAGIPQGGASSSRPMLCNHTSVTFPKRSVKKLRPLRCPSCQDPLLWTPESWQRGQAGTPWPTWSASSPLHPVTGSFSSGQYTPAQLSSISGIFWSRLSYVLMMFWSIHLSWSLKFLNTSNLLRHAALTVQHHVTETDYLTTFLKKMTGGNNKMSLHD